MVIYVVNFPPNFGGNHLGNLILTALGSDRINDALIDYYANEFPQEKITHSGSLIRDNIRLPNVGLNLDKNASILLTEYISQFDDFCVVVGHIDEIYHTYSELCNLGEVVLLNLEIDDISCIKRNESLLDEYQYWIYNSEPISKLLQVPREAIIDVPVSMLWDSDITGVLDKLTNIYEFDKNIVSNDIFNNLSKKILTFDYTLCKLLHTEWLNSFKEKL